jgi:hypothetical protein
LPISKDLTTLPQGKLLCQANIKASTFKPSSPNSFSKQDYDFNKTRWARNVAFKLEFNQYWG